MEIVICFNKNKKGKKNIYVFKYRVIIDFIICFFFRKII